MFQVNLLSPDRNETEASYYHNTTLKHGQIAQYKIIKHFTFEGVLCKSFNTKTKSLYKSLYFKSFNTFLKISLMVTIHGRSI